MNNDDFGDLLTFHSALLAFQKWDLSITNIFSWGVNLMLQAQLS